MRNPFARLAKSDIARPSLRERAASLKASAARAIRRQSPIKITDQPSDETLTVRSRVEDLPETFTTSECVTHDQTHRAGTSTEGGGRLREEISMGRHETFESETIADALALSLPVMGRAAAASDPIFVAISTTRDLTWARNRALNMELPPETEDPTPEQNVATDAFFAHVNDVLLKTVPTTAAGCAALARYAGEFRSDYGFNIDEDASNEQHVRILDLIARSPLLNGLPPAQPPVPDFSGYTTADLMRTYNAFKMATDIMGLTGWATSPEGVGDRLLDEENDRLSFFQGYLADELKRRVLLDRTEMGWRADIVINRAIACGDYDEAACFAAEAATKHL